MPTAHTLATMNHIDIEVKTSYIESQSTPEEDRFVFAYAITIRNSGTEAAQLLTRHWIITDANGKVQEVKGEGVVGEKPLLQPGDNFHYTSGTILETPVGSMHGSYQMRTEQGDEFDAPIAPFTLAIPHSLH